MAEIPYNKLPEMQQLGMKLLAYLVFHEGYFHTDLFKILTHKCANCLINVLMCFPKVLNI